MPSYKNTLNRDQIQAIVDFLEEAEKKANPQKPPLPGELETLDYKINVEVVAEGLDIPWAITFIDENNILVTERPGPLRIIRNGKLDPEPIKNTPEVVAEGQGGLLDVAVDPGL